MLVGVGKRAHDAKIEGDELAAFSLRGGDLDVARMHVGVEKTVAKHLGEKNLHAGAGEGRDVDPRGAQRVDLADRRAVHALHGHHRRVAPVPVDFGHFHQRRAGKVAPQLRGIGRFARQVQFVVQVLGEFGHHFARLQALSIGPQRLDQPGGDVEQRDVFFDQRGDARAQDLQRHLGAGVGTLAQHGKMHLRHRGARNRLGLKVGECRLDGATERLFDFGACLGGRKGRHLVLQFGQFVGDVLGQQVAPCREHLPELDENRTQRLKGLPQPYGARLAEFAPWQRRLDEHRNTARRGGKEEFLQTEAKGDRNDA